MTDRYRDTDRQTHREADRWTDRQRERERQTDTEANRQRQTSCNYVLPAVERIPYERDREIDRQTDRQTVIHTYILTDKTAKFLQTYEEPTTLT